MSTGLRRSGTRGRQRGQAMVEMAVLSAVLVPLFLLVPTLSKYFHAKQMAQQAARAAAWEATVTRDFEFNQLNGGRAAQLAFIREHNFGDADTVIRSNISGNATGRLKNEMLNTFSNRELVRAQDITLDAYRNEAPSGLSGLFGRIGGLLEKLPGEFPPNKNGLVTAQVTLRPQNLKTRNGAGASYLAPFDRINLELRSHHTLLADEWNAAGNGLDGQPSARRERSVLNQVKTLAPTSALDGAGDFFEKIEGADFLPIVGPIARLRPGYVQPDIVPSDKLKRR
ncbi:TadE/TadG family type IV pilus assembly protein [Marilutibacter chinensis]|uniref:Pilus assembly protein n=1 Tax=Marilutibacter chinensis TaxID=2912247 RepID=A0ABS9HYY9_9GAMM|nr:TadE/TadG family type IV pilus assembly protein [Lysobacter chinensis]MCF7223602.1 pilus assembly protein [Lysobacter chinensis]